MRPRQSCASASPARSRRSELSPDHSAILDSRANTAPHVPRTVIASQLRLLRDGLADALERRCSVHVVAVAADTATLRAAVRTQAPDVVLLDVTFDRSLAIVREIVSQSSARIIAFAVGEDDQELVACIEAGVAAYIARDGTLDDVIAAVTSVARGETIISPRFAASLFRRLAALERERRAARSGDASRSSPSTSLSAREREILALIDKGLANKEIAGHLCIELATVKNHVHRILQKLRVARRGQAVAQLHAGALAERSTLGSSTA